MKSTEVTLQLKMTYKELVTFLLEKYGPVPFDYFESFEGELLRVNSKNSRAYSDGLFIHHIDEDKAILLSKIEYAKINPFKYQTSERLVYCNILEHLLLHFKIYIEAGRNEVTRYNVGIGGALTYLCLHINDYYVGYNFKAKYWEKVFFLIKDNFDDYLKVLEYLISNLIDVVEKNQLLALIKKLTRASNGKQCSAAKEYLERYVDEQKLSRQALEIILENASRGSSEEAFKIALLYKNGVKVEYSKRQTIKWCRIAINDKNPEIIYKVAKVLVFIGESSADYLALIRESAELGFCEAQAEMGRLLSGYMLSGSYFDKEREEGKEWLEKAIKQGHQGAKSIFIRNFLNPNSPHEIVEQAMFYLIERANEGDEDSLLMLAREYFKGETIPRNYRKSLEYYLMAEKQGSKIAKEELQSNSLVFLKNL